MAILMLFELFSRKFCLNILTLILSASPNMMYFRRCDWLDQLREYAASNEIFCLLYYHHSTLFRTTRLRIIRLGNQVH